MKWPITLAIVGWVVVIVNIFVHASFLDWLAFFTFLVVIGIIIIQLRMKVNRLEEELYHADISVREMRVMLTPKKNRKK